MRSVPNMYILNLAISDVIYRTVLVSEASAKRISDTWLEGDFLCTFLPFCHHLSAYSVAVFSFQRYRVIANPFQVRVSSLLWPQFVECGFRLHYSPFHQTSENIKCEGFVSVGCITFYWYVVVFELLVSCVLPLCAVAFSYIMTARHLVESFRSISERTQNPQLNTCKNTAKIVVWLTVVFLISHVHYHAFWTYIICTEELPHNYDRITNILRDSNYKLQYPYLISTCFLLINSCLSPVAVFCTSSPFRQHLKRYLTSFGRTNSPNTGLELARRNWVCNHFLYFLQLQLGYIFLTNFHLINYNNENKFCCL